MKTFSIFILVLLILIGCDHGLEPAEPKDKITGISGTVYFQNWPSVDSLKHLRIVAFISFPPQDIFTELISETAFAYPAISDTGNLPYFVDSVYYQFELAAGEYQYIAVAQHYETLLFSGWRAVGQYDTDATPEPTAVTVFEDSLLENIDINVDFKNLPIQPFKK